MSKPNYLVHAPAYNPDSGGGIFLHMLVHTLRQLGEEAWIWPWYRDPQPGLRCMVNSVIRKPSLLLGYGKRFLDPRLDTPIAGFEHFREDSIVIYPEITLGNPMGAINVVRWLLYKPGEKDPYRFTEGEMFFRVNPMFDLPEITGGATDLAIPRIDPVYRNENRPDRKGACYMVRKGKDKPRIPETADAICIDGMNHAQVADVMNSCEIFYTYDEATMFSHYAVLCGCDSVVVPGFYDNREQWAEEHDFFRHGIAYGVDDLPHARATAHKVAELLAAKEQEGVEMVRNFVALTRERFG